MRPHLLPLALLVSVACGAGGSSLERQPPGTGAGGAEPRLRDATETHLPPAAAEGRSMEARAGDYDGDGDPDLFVAKEFGPNLLLLNDGAGRFSDAGDRIPRPVHDSEDIAATDVDGDGDLDVVVVAEDDRTDELLLNDGAGRFSDGGDRLPRAGVSNAVAAGDVDGDGDADLVIGNNGPDFLFLNDGAGRFSDATDERLPAYPGVTQDVALGDVDGDGDLDLLVGSEGDNRLLLNDGGGRFAEAPEGSLPLRASGEMTRNADLGDADGDGDLDVFFSNVNFTGFDDPQDRLLLNDGAGRFTDATAERLPPIGAGTADADWIDLDGDGDLDLVTVGLPRTEVRVLLNDGSGRFTLAEDVLPGRIAMEAVEVEAADFDGDGRPDLYLAGFRDADRLLLSGPE